MEAFIALKAPEELFSKLDKRVATAFEDTDPRGYMDCRDVELLNSDLIDAGLESELGEASRREVDAVVVALRVTVDFFVAINVVVCVE